MRIIQELLNQLFGVEGEQNITAKVNEKPKSLGEATV